MRTIMVMNPKGGCGKTTIATNLASHYANQGLATVLADFDPQRSSLDWLAMRSEDRPAIHGVAGFEDGLRGVGRGADVLIIDAPARAHGPELTEMVRRAETILVPVLPSPVDIFAAKRFADELQQVGKVERKEVRIGLIANRVRDTTLIAHDLGVFLNRMHLPIVGRLRDAQNYIRAFARGMGVNELPPYLALPDVRQWEEVTGWLNSKRSQP
ncbi:MAG TPA: ParA family protein [Gammaproteobacteria bacterium]|nr:ParA family protein [Gammaproteobacteria bacterium]HET7587989.1 ParA family protein [Gammaproteobacteria bacterium]